MQQTLHPDTSELLEQAHRFDLQHLAGPTGQKPLRRVVAMSNFHDDAVITADSLVVVMDGTISLTSFEVDFLLRMAIEHGALGVVLSLDPRIHGEDPPSIGLARSAIQLARRGSLPVFVTLRRDLPNLVLDLDRFIRQDSQENIDRAQYVMRMCADAADGDISLAGLLDVASEVLHQPVRFVEDVTEMPRYHVLRVDGRNVGALETEPSDDTTDLILSSLSHLASLVYAEEMARRRDPQLSRAEAIMQLVLSDEAHVPQIVPQLHALGFPLVQYHTAAWITFKRGTEDTATSGKIRLILEGAERVFRESWPFDSERRQVIRFVDGLLVLATEAEPGSRAYAGFRDEITQRLTQLDTLPAADWVAGLGTTLSGAEGLRTSVTRAKVVSQSQGRSLTPGSESIIAEADGTGLELTLLEIYSSRIARDHLLNLISPFAELPEGQRHDMTVTLLKYLENLNSPTAAARQLHLHPNAVAYRIRRIQQILGLDLGDPDTRLSLLLACRLAMV